MLSGKQNIFFSIIPAMIISLLFVTPFMVSDEIYNGVIMAKEFWFFGVVALMLLYSAIQILIKKGKLRIEFNIVDILLLAFYTWCFIRAIFTPYTPFWHNHKLQILTGMMVVYFFVKNAIRNENYENYGGKNYSFIPSFIHSFIPKPFIISFLIFSFILSGFLQAIYGLLQLYGIYPSYNSYFKITGSFFNPAPYAMYLAVVFPVALGQMLMKNERIKNEWIKKYSFIFSFLHSFTQKYLPIATVIAIILVLPATMNRASWLGALAGSLVVLQYKYSWLQQIKNWLNTRAKKIIGITVSVVLVCGIGLSLFYMKAGSSNGRLFIWEVTLGKIAEKPLFGHGLGRFEAEYNNWQAEYFMKHPEEMDGPKGWVAGNTKYAFNEFLEMWVEQGTLGVLLFSALITCTMLYAWQSNIHIFSCFWPLIVITGLSFPFYSIGCFPLLILTVAFTSVIIPNKILTLPTLKCYRICNSLLLIIVSMLVFRHINIIHFVYKSWQKANTLYVLKDYETSTKEFKKNYYYLKYDYDYLLQYGKCMYAQGNKLDAKLTILKASKLGGDYTLYISLGDTYKDKGQFTASEASYSYASKMIPSKLYPHFKLFKLYIKARDIKKANNKGNEILKMSPKINNQTSKEIRIETERQLLKLQKIN